MRVFKKYCGKNHWPQSSCSLIKLYPFWQNSSKCRLWKIGRNWNHFFYEIPSENRTQFFKQQNIRALVLRYDTMKEWT